MGSFFESLQISQLVVVQAIRKLSQETKLPRILLAELHKSAKKIAHDKLLPFDPKLSSFLETLSLLSEYKVVDIEPSSKKNKNLTSLEDSIVLRLSCEELAQALDEVPGCELLC